MISMIPPPGLLKKLQDAINKFIWGGKKPRVAMAQMILPKTQGGLRLPSVTTNYQATSLHYVIKWNRPLSSKHWDFMDQAVAGRNIWRELWLPRKHRVKGLYKYLLSLPLPCKCGTA